MMKTLTLSGLVALLAACGGSGTPEPVQFTFDTDGLADVIVTSDTLTLNGEQFALGDFVVTVSEGDTTISRSDTDYVNLARVERDGSFAAIIATDPDDGRDAQNDRISDDPESKEGRAIQIPSLGTIQTGSASFSGDYAGLLIQRVGFTTSSLSPSSERDAIKVIVTGDVALEVDFAEHLSESTLSGAITNRDLRRAFDGDDVFSFSLADARIENGRIDDIGQFRADVVDGEWTIINPNLTAEWTNTTEDGTVEGQLGDDTAGGFVRLTHDVFRRDNGVETSRNEYTEIGAFIATRDE